MRPCTCNLNVCYGERALIKTLCLLYEDTTEKDGRTNMWTQAMLSVWKQNRSNGKKWKYLELTRGRYIFIKTNVRRPPIAKRLWTLGLRQMYRNWTWGRIWLSQFLQNYPRSSWQMKEIPALFPDHSGTIRFVLVKAHNAEFRYPI